MMMKLLLVEDATIYLILLQKLLENDFQITLSKNIADAKEIIDDQDYQFDVILIDLITEGAMDLIRQIKKNKRLAQVPIVAKIYNLDTAKWLINEKLNENKNGTKTLFSFPFKRFKRNLSTRRKNARG